MLYFEDLQAGQVYKTDSVTLDQDYLVDFAKEYDPQPFHTDPEAAKDSFFGQLVGSGWQTTAITMKLMENSLDIAGGLIGFAVDELRWPKPTYPGDALRAEITVLDGARKSNSKPDYGIGKIDVKTLNQHDEVVQSMRITLWIPVKP